MGSVSVTLLGDSFGNGSLIRIKLNSPEFFLIALSYLLYIYIVGGNREQISILSCSFIHGTTEIIKGQR